MLTKLNILNIVSDHFRTLKSYSGQKYSWAEIIVFFGLPLIVAIILISWGSSITDSGANVLITSLSIFAGLLLNLLMLVFDTLNKEDSAAKKTSGLEQVRKKLLQETYANISYCILISLLSVLILMGFAMWDKGVTTTIEVAIKQIASGIVYFLVFNFLLTLLMVLKRVHSLMSGEFR